jgi:hypothetical protein
MRLAPFLLSPDFSSSGFCFWGFPCIICPFAGQEAGNARPLNPNPKVSVQSASGIFAIYLLIRLIFSSLKSSRKL